MSKKVHIFSIFLEKAPVLNLLFPLPAALPSLTSSKGTYLSSPACLAHTASMKSATHFVFCFPFIIALSTVKGISYT